VFRIGSVLRVSTVGWGFDGRSGTRGLLLRTVSEVGSARGRRHFSESCSEIDLCTLELETLRLWQGVEEIEGADEVSAVRNIRSNHLLVVLGLVVAKAKTVE
jgi:hypothetical protein